MGNERISIAGRGAEVLHDSKLVRCPHSLDPTLVTSSVRLGPSMSLIPFAPFSKLSQRGLEVFALSDLSLLTSDLRPPTSDLWLCGSPLPVRRSDGLAVASSLLPRSKLWSQSLVKA